MATAGRSVRTGLTSTIRTVLYVALAIILVFAMANFAYGQTEKGESLFESFFSLDRYLGGDSEPKRGASEPPRLSSSEIRDPDVAKRCTEFNPQKDPRCLQTEFCAQVKIGSETYKCLPNCDALEEDRLGAPVCEDVKECKHIDGGGRLGFRCVDRDSKR